MPRNITAGIDDWDDIFARGLQKSGLSGTQMLLLIKMEMLLPSPSLLLVNNINCVFCG